MVELQAAPRWRPIQPSRVNLRMPRVDPPALAAWTVAFAIVTYLSLRGGGYDIVVRSQTGLIVWWLILVGALAGILPGAIGRRGWTAFGLLAGFTLWTALAIRWSQSAEQSVIELGRLASYLGVLALALALTRRTAARHMLNGLTCALAVVTVLAVLSRLLPHVFSGDQHFQFLGSVSARKLSYPLGYWNALGDFAAMGAPLLLAASVGARTAAMRALATATLPVSALCIYMTISRGGVIALGIGVLVFMVLVPRRLEALATLAPAALAAAVLLRAAAARSALSSGLDTHAAVDQGASLLALSLGVCLLVAGLRLAGERVARRVTLPALLAPDRRGLAKRALAVAAVALVAAAAAGAPGKLAHAWHDFKQPTGVVVPRSESSVFTRLSAANGNSRYQFWQSALKAEATRPCCGIGPGTFQLWWAAHATAPGFIRNAHSLYFETLAETGIVGLALLGGLWLWLSGVAVLRALREPAGVRLWLAGASASLAVFLFAAAVEWVWQLAAMAAAALILGAAIVAGRGDHDPPARRARPFARRLAAVVVSLLALGAILVPMAGHLAIQDSQAAAADGHLGVALSDSRAAERLQPYAASAHLQEALVLEAAGELGPAAAAASVATQDSPTDWTTWITLARIDARRGDTGPALAALARARRLNPRSPWFSSP